MIFGDPIPKDVLAGTPYKPHGSPSFQPSLMQQDCMSFTGFYLCLSTSYCGLSVLLLLYLYWILSTECF